MLECSQGDSEAEDVQVAGVGSASQVLGQEDARPPRCGPTSILREVFLFAA